MSEEKRFVGAKPSGLLGTLAGIAMNVIHIRRYRKIIRRIRDETPGPVSSIVDIGCGGGIALKHFAALFPGSKVTGVDHSRDMVELSLKSNRANVRSALVTVRHNCVERMEIETGSADIVTVFDAINFWEDYERAFAEIKRILKPEGTVYVVNGYPKIGTKWYDFVKFKDEGSYRNLLIFNGFRAVTAEIENHTILIRGKK